MSQYSYTEDDRCNRPNMFAKFQEYDLGELS